MAKVIRLHKIGGPENLQLDDVAVGQPGEGEVRLQVQAVGLNRAEAMYMRGFYFEQPQIPSRIGYEAAGIVKAVGAGVDSSWVGKRIATVPGYSMNRWGVLGEEAIVPADSLGEYPASLSPAEGSAIWMQYLTAYGALITVGNVHQGDFVLITAASSSVGLAAIQIVKAEGAIPIAATRRSNKRDALLALGAAHVIATEEQDLPAEVKRIAGGKGARVIFDPVAGPFLEKLAEATAPGGVVLVYGLLSQQPTPLPLIAVLRGGLTIRGYSLQELRRDVKLLATAKQYVYDRLSDGRFHPKIAQTFPLERSVDAYQYLESNAQVGKVVITT